MRIKIYQINNDSDKYMVKFRDYEFTVKKCGKVLPEIYEFIYEGTVQATGPEDVYRIFNDERPYDFKGHSLSVSDVVEIISEDSSTFHFCDSFGFKDIEFDSSKVRRGVQ